MVLLRRFRDKNIGFITISVLLLPFLLVGCGAPSKKQVSEDFKGLFSITVGKGVQPIIISIGPGEGDSDNVYEYVKFGAKADEDVLIKKGWLSGRYLRKGQKLYDGEVVMLYQKLRDSQWKMTRSYLKRVPSEHPVR